MTPEKRKQYLTEQQLLGIFGVEPGTVMRWIKFGLTFEKEGRVKLFHLAATCQWVHQHLTAGYLSLEQVAQMFGVEPRTVTKFVNEFGMPRSLPGFYKRDEVVRWREKYLAGKLRTLQQGGMDGVSATTQLKQEKVLRERMKRLQEERQLVNIAEVMPVFTSLLSNMRTNASTMGQSCARQVVGLPINEAAQRIQREINDLFTEFAGLHHSLERLGPSVPGGAAEVVVGAAAAPGDVHKPARRGKKIPEPGVRRRAGKVSHKHGAVSKRNDGRRPRPRG